MPKVSVSLLSANPLYIGDFVRTLENCDADLLHIDIMDGHFVPNIALGLDIVKTLSSFSKIPQSIHLMVERPDNFIKSIAIDGVSYITVHSELDEKIIMDCIKIIHECNISAGIAINPSTNIDALHNFIDIIDYVLVMGVEPGFGGQNMIMETLDKIPLIRKMSKNRNLEIGFDGGVNEDTIDRVKSAEPDVIIAGRYLTKNLDKNLIANKIRELKKI